MVQKKSSELNNWFFRLVRWLRTFLTARGKPSAVIKTRRYSVDKTGALFTLERDIPGAVETWRLVNSSGGLLVILDNLSDSRTYYKAQRSKARESGKHYQTTAEERGLRLEGGATHTHRFSFSWLDWSGQKHRVRLLGVFDGDFAGFTRTYSAELKQRTISVTDESLKRRLGNASAVKIGEAIALELLELKDLPGFSWEERICGYDWQALLHNYANQVHRRGFDAQIVCRSR